MVQAVGAAVRPVEAELIAHWATEHLAYGHAKRLCLYVDERVLDRRDRLLGEATRRLARFCVEVCSDAFDRSRVLADQGLGKFQYDTGEPLRAVALVVFGPADDPGVRLNLQKREDAPARVRMHVHDACD